MPKLNQSLKVGECAASLLPLYCFALLSSSGGPLSRPVGMCHHLFVASVSKEACYCPMHLMPEVETSLKTFGQ